VTHNNLMILIGLATFGVLMLALSAGRRARKAAKAARDAARTASLLGRVVITAGVIGGAQYAVIRFVHHNLTLLVVTLAVPALLAAATTVRATTVTTISTGRKGTRR
jgi:hypothetical protein